MRFSFLVLPLHPPPLPQESLTSYLIRLAETNGFTSVNALSTVNELGLAHQARQPDAPISNFGSLAEITAQSVESLLGLTFYHLMDKFGRGSPGQRVGPFLKDAVVKHLRYCPACVAEYRYYKLAWRFPVLEGCVEHHCTLIEVCPHCGQANRLLGQPLQIGVCQSCQRQLIEAPPVPLDALQQQNAQKVQQALDFILTSQPIVTGDVSATLGPWLACLRKEENYTVAQVAKSIGATSEMVKGIESSDFTISRGERFVHYWRYAHMLKTDLETLFTTLSIMLEQQPNVAEWNRTQFYELSLLQKAENAAAIIEQDGRLLTQSAIAESLGMTVASLRYYPRLREFLAPLADDNRLAALRKEREEALIKQVTTAIAELQKTGETITTAEIGRRVGRTPESLRSYPRVVALIEQVLVLSDKRAAQREQELFIAVQNAIYQLQSEGKIITQNAVGRIVGLVPETLKSYASIQPVMAEIAGNYEAHMQQRENQLLIAVRQAANQLQQEQRPVNQEDIAQIVGLTVNSLKHHPKVHNLLKKLTRDYRHLNYELKQAQREQGIIDAIRQAGIELSADNQLITRDSILDFIGVSSRTISRYKEAREILKEIVALYNKV